MNKAIKIWRFENAPVKYQELTKHGGDEDWVALVPKEVWKSEYAYIPFLEEGTSFGCCDVSRDKLANGDMILIGAHA